MTALLAVLERFVAQRGLTPGESWLVIVVAVLAVWGLAVLLWVLFDLAWTVGVAVPRQIAEGEQARHEDAFRRAQLDQQRMLTLRVLPGGKEPR